MRAKQNRRYATRRASDLEPLKDGNEKELREEALTDTDPSRKRKREGKLNEVD